MGKEMKKENIENIYLSRRKHILRKIKNDALLVTSGPTLPRAPDQEHPFIQDSNFYYLTGFEEPNSALLLLGNSKGPRSILFLRERDAIAEKWQGERLGINRAKRRFNIDEVRNITEFEQELPILLSSSRVLHYAPGINSKVDRFIWTLFASISGPRINFPHTLRDARLLLSEMRLIKDRYEIQTIKHAVDITTHAFLELIPSISKLSSEAHAARTLEQHFANFGASGTAFPTIVASGKNATCLHHSPKLQPLWKRELVLVDAGVKYRGYASDITRTFPVSGKFTSAQAEVYNLVYNALQAGIAKAKPGNSLDTIHKSTVRELTKGLISIGVLSGDLSQNISTEKYKPFFMHRCSHYLGLDVHDIQPNYDSMTDTMIPPYSRPLMPGMIFTIEPGLYFDPKYNKVNNQYRGIGVRLEEDILITNNGCEVLTKQVPTKLTEIESIMS
jgi:Xaa-Pro aminopeptidase